MTPFDAPARRWLTSPIARETISERFALQSGPVCVSLRGDLDPSRWAFDAGHRRFLSPTILPQVTLQIEWQPARQQDGRPVVYLDGPGGTQVPQRVIDAVARYYRETNANHGGAFATSVRSDEILREAHVAVADLLGAASPAEVKFGQNMTSLAFALSRSTAAQSAWPERS